MALTEDDVREILRIIDESPLAEIRVKTDGFSLHVVRSSVPATSEAPDPAGDLVTVVAPMLGVFYRADAPGEAPFVERGSRVEPDTTVCIIEVMKMMNSVMAGVAGTIVEVCQENGAVIKEGAPLFRIAAG